MKVYSYLRWSTLEQGNNDRSSEDRQRIATEAYAREHRWEISETLIDKGRSAFSGENLSKGKLGEFTRALITSVVDARDTILLVEELDRLSRRPPAEMVSWMMPLLMLGLTIHVANTRQVLTQDIVNRDFGAFLHLMSGAFSAYDFSRKQQDRGNAAWEKRRQAAIEGVTHSRHRARKWLTWDATSRCYREIPERVEVVKEMFRLRLAGWGKASIAKLFNERATEDSVYKVWVSTIKKQPERWTPSAVGRIVQDMAVTGYLQYTRSPRGSSQRVPIGEPVKVYPEIIDPETFARANSKRHVEQLKYQGRGRAVSNLLGRLARCNSCGGLMTAMGSSRWHTNKDGSKSQYYFLYCQANKMSKGLECGNSRGWSYAGVETPILDKLLTLAIDDQHFKVDDEESARLEGRVIVLQRKLADLELAARRFAAMIRANPRDEIAPSEYAAIISDIEAAKVDLADAQEALAGAQGLVSPQDHILRVSEVRSNMFSEIEAERYNARSLVKEALHNLIEEVRFEPYNGNITVQLVDHLAAFFIKDGKLTGEMDLRAMYPDAWAGDGRFGVVEVKSGDKITVYGDLTTDQERAADAFLRRQGNAATQQ